MKRDEAYLLDILIAARKHSRINLEAVWETVRNDLPGLIAQVEPMIPPEEGS